MARAALKWSTKDLASASGVGLNTVNRFEADGDISTRESKIEQLKETLEKAGVTFTNSGCVCPPKGTK